MEKSEPDNRSFQPAQLGQSCPHSKFVEPVRSDGQPSVHVQRQQSAESLNFVSSESMIDKACIKISWKRPHRECAGKLAISAFQTANTLWFTESSLEREQ